MPIIRATSDTVYSFLRSIMERLTFFSYLRLAISFRCIGFTERLSSYLHEIEHLLATVVDSGRINLRKLFKGEICGSVRELIVAQVVTALENVLHHVLEIAPPPGGCRLTSKFIKSLARACYVGLEGIVAAIARFIGKLGANVDDICHSEPVPHTVNGRVYLMAELPDNSEQC